MKRYAKVLALLALAFACLFAACGGQSESAGGDGNATAGPTATPSPTPEPPYLANVLTGEEQDADYENLRITSVMINNLNMARPQRGLSDAQMLFEIKVEGGITRFMAVFNDYNDIQEIGPIRSARDQYFRLIMAFQSLYVHEGQSVVQAQYVQDYDYSKWNINDGAYGYRNRNRVNWAGQSNAYGNLAIEHTMYTTGENIAQYIEDKNIDMDKTYNSTYFKFMDYRKEDHIRTLDDGEEAGLVTIAHSQSYRTRFIYDDASTLYKMQQYYSPDNSWRDTNDENNGKQLEYTNLVVLFTDIHVYPGHEAKDLQYADYDFGGIGYYFYGGKAERIYWQKGTPLEALRLYYLTPDGKCSDEMLDVNIGKSYVAVVDLDEYYNFKYESLEGADLTSKENTTYVYSAAQAAEQERYDAANDVAEDTGSGATIGTSTMPTIGTSEMPTADNGGYEEATPSDVTYVDGGEQQG